jgi:hypothetical protein
VGCLEFVILDKAENGVFAYASLKNFLNFVSNEEFRDDPCLHQPRVTIWNHPTALS